MEGGVHCDNRNCRNAPVRAVFFQGVPSGWQLSQEMFQSTAECEVVRTACMLWQLGQLMRFGEPLWHSMQAGSNVCGICTWAGCWLWQTTQFS